MSSPLRSIEFLEKSIVTCPSCGTKFGVDSDLLTTQESANFHCSKCDHVFLESVKKIQAQNKLSLAQNSDAQSRRAQPVRPKETPRFEAPHETSQSMESVQVPEELSKPKPKIFKKKKSHKTITGFNWLKNNPFSTKKVRNVTQVTEARPEVYQSNEPSWRELLSLATPILVFLFGLTLVSFYFVRYPGDAREVLTTLLPSAPHVPPEGLHISNSAFRRVVLDTGEEISLISGTIKNNSTSYIKHIELEGQAFAKDGSLLQTSRANASSNLANTRIKSLSTSMITSLQSGKSGKRFLLAPNKEHDFTLALFGPELRKANFFSARIYSVRSSG